jgi:aminoglycoside 6'-N-acetyltransferase I
MTLDIRLLGRDELTVLDRVAPDVFDRPIDSRWCAEFLADPRHHLAVAIDGDLVVGMASALNYVHPDKAPQLFINEVAVAQTHQGQRIGRRLLDVLMELAADLECTEAWVLTNEENVNARRLYAGVPGAIVPEGCLMYTFPVVPVVIADGIDVATDAGSR